MLPLAVQVADPFHVVKLAGTALDEVRRRVQNETCGHRGRCDDPLWRVRRRLSIAAERLTVDQHERLVGLLRAGAPELADQWVAEIIRDFADEPMPIEIRRLGRGIKKWAAQITAWHRTHVSNGPTEGVNERIKRVAFCLVHFRHHRVRGLPYAGKPDWALLNTIQP